MKKLKKIPMESEDLHELKKWLANEEIYKNLNLLYRPMSITELQQWFEREKSDGANIFKYINIENHICGIGLIHYIHHKNRCGELSVIINPEMSGKGYGKNIFTNLMIYSFEILNLNKIFFHTTIYNKRVFSIAESLGFVKEGVFRKEHYYSGEYHDTYRFGLLIDEYKANRAK